MGKDKSKNINNPILNDFVYTVLYNASYEEKRGLTGKYLKAAMNERAAKSFASNSTLEEKIYLLSHFGMEHFFVFAKRGLSLQKFRDILTKFEANKKVSALKDISQDGVFVTGDKEFLRLLGFMAQSIHHPSFFLNLEFNRQGFHIQKWKKRNLNDRDLQLREIDENASNLAKIMLNGCLSMDYARTLMNIMPSQLKILLYLYSMPHAYVSDITLGEYFVGRISRLEFRSAIKTLLNGFLIQQNDEEKSYTIAGPGIKKVNEYFKAVFTFINF